MKSKTSGKKHSRWRNDQHFKEYVRNWSKRIKVSPSGIYLQSTKNKWASCSTTGRITFSKDLLEEKIYFGEFVIVHELLHMKIKNHGKLFKALLKAYLPDWEDRIRSFNKSNEIKNSELLKDIGLSHIE